MTPSRLPRAGEAPRASCPSLRGFEHRLFREPRGAADTPSRAHPDSPGVAGADPKGAGIWLGTRLRARTKLGHVILPPGGPPSRIQSASRVGPASGWAGPSTATSSPRRVSVPSEVGAAEGARRQSLDTRRKPGPDPSLVPPPSLTTRDADSPLDRQWRGTLEPPPRVVPPACVPP